MNTPPSPPSRPAETDATIAAAVPVADAAEGSKSGGPGVREIGGRKDGSEPTRFGDWERNGRCIDF